MNYIQIGAVILNTDEPCPIYVDLDSATAENEPLEVFVYDGFDSAFLLSNIIVTDVVELKTPAVVKLMDRYSAEGALLTEKHLIILKNGTANWLPLANMDVIEVTTEYDTDAYYDDFDIEGVI